MAGKKYDDATKRFDRDQLFSAPEALDLVKSLAPAKFISNRFVDRTAFFFFVTISALTWILALR